ncbi:DUF4328 domain-containing protein [Streptomyces sp. AK02-01A]|uniref:DUF4328 domain-containing protein n=1 Tax=Streptomyces sp. AK02-01A TaxID=3028648 RepID=UPI0029BD2695|nr:DUF4328 domain-containing protein [Streptomyces sp. AK02-01A]MDX3853217.1 DUF4328 domain-containing protein [Streptomyces sp. AK02-01A]
MSDPRRLAIAAQVVICVELLTQFALVLLGEGAAEDFPQAMQVMALVTGVSFVVLICWLRRCRLNAEAFAPGTHRYRPGFAIGGWFIPVAMFWIPRRVTLDTRRASGLSGRSLLVEGWWWTRLVKVPVALAVTSSTTNPMFSPYVALLSTTSGIMLLLAIREITAAQVARTGTRPTDAVPATAV